MQDLKQYTDRIVAILEDPRLSGPDQRMARRAAVRNAALEMFDGREASRRALGVHWAKLTPAEQQEFVRLFLELLERAYVTKVDLYSGQRVRYVGESVDGDAATVRARVITKRGSEVPVETRMLRHGGRWLVYDVFVENIGLLANYRAQFDKIIRTSSYRELVRRLEKGREE
jgi:phospholipid transport system substrate-binding protein